MTDDDKKKTGLLVKLEQTGGPPPGYNVERVDDEKWKWSGMIDGQLRMATADNKESAMAIAWLHFWTKLFGWIPPGYTVASDPAGHIWTLLEDGKPPVQSYPKASREEAQVEAWVDFKCVLLDVKRPATIDASGDPRAMMAKFQQGAFELVTVETELRRLERRRDVLVMEMQRLGIAFNDAINKMDKTEKG